MKTSEPTLRHFVARIKTAALFLVVTVVPVAGSSQEARLESDLTSPTMQSGEPKAGIRFRGVAPEYQGTEVYHAVYLPNDWEPKKRSYPVLVEYTGNRFATSGSTGEVKDANLGFGLTGGEKFIWVSMPYIAANKQENALLWWGEHAATVDYCKQNLPRICQAYGGDPDRIFLCGFSRGAIAVSYIGLADDEIARLWKGFITHDHFDGQREWNYPKSDRAAALERLRRLRGRPVLVCGGGNDFLQDHLDLAEFTFLKPDIPSIFDIPENGVVHPHTDLWMHRQSEARDKARAWLEELAQVELP